MIEKPTLKRLCFYLMQLTMLAGIFGASSTSGLFAQEPTPKQRTNSGLIALFDFEKVDGFVKDASGLQPQPRFKFDPSDSIIHKNGTLEFKKNSLLKSDEITPRIAAAIIRSGELTFEAWIHPANVTQKGPARILTYSRNSNDRSFTIGQNGNRFEFRVRSTKTSNNGIPSLFSSAGSAKTELTHLAYTRDRTGRTRIYVNGELDIETFAEGDLTNWTADFQLGIGNELDGNRPWLGKIHLLAIYQRDLLPHEVRTHFELGADASTRPVYSGDVSNSKPKNHFTSTVAPIIAQHCLECHDSSTKEGGLDLASEESAFAGSDSGSAIVAGKPYESNFWTQVVSNEMPQDREPLSAEEKQALKDWIDDGAKWSGGVIDVSTASTNQLTTGIWVRRLTVPEYIATVQATLDVDIASDARAILPPDLRADGFSNTAYNLNVDMKHVRAYARLAELIVKRTDMAKFIDRFSEFDSSAKLTNESIRPFVKAAGKWLFRGPLEDHDQEVYLQIAETVANAGGDSSEAAAFILEAMLQAPRFIYQMESQRGDGSRYPVGDFELASRLSFLLWGASPDQELYAAVERGEFYDRSGVEQQIERMLDDPRAIDRSIEFLNQWLNLERLAHMQPNEKTFPDWDPKLAGDMQTETIEFFKEIVWNQNRPLVDILNAQVTFASPRLARHYGLTANVSLDSPSVELSNSLSTFPSTSSFDRFDLASDDSRGGLLTQGSVLTIGGDEASMVTRGLFVLKDLLRGSVSNPPPGVDTSPVPSKPGLSQRMVSESRIADTNCGGCHGKFEPLAFGLERFDGLGGYAENDEHGNKLREDGEVLFPGQPKPTSYASISELMDLLATSDRVKETLTWKVTQFAIGRPLTSADSDIVKEIHRNAEQIAKDQGVDGATYRSLVTAIALSDLVQTTQTEIMPSDSQD